MPTPHNNAQKGDFAKTVLMPGDPLRAEFIANTFLENPRKVTGVRGMYGFTGTYHGKPISVMGSGMGMPSIGIYSYELYHEYGVENIIRVGSAGLLQPFLKVRSIVAGMSAYSNSNYGAQFGFKGNLAPCASFQLLEKAVAAARRMGVEMPVGPIYSTDVFYDETKPSPAQVLQGLGVLAVEMEAYALYLNAARAGKNALALLTISDNPFTGESLTPQEVRETFTQMMEIALEIA